MTLPQISLAVIGLITLSGFTAFAVVSLKEKQGRATRIATLLALLSLITFTAILLLPASVHTGATIIISLGLLVGVILFIWPAREDYTPSPPPTGRVDERTTIFARVRLKPGAPEYEAYYHDHPEHQAPDDVFRANPGLLAPGALFYHNLLASSPEGGFFLTESLRHAVDGPVASDQTRHKPEKLTRFIKDLAAYHGASDAGICVLQPYHIYSHVGRGTGSYGAPVTLDHHFAIALTVEMDHAMLNAAPRLPTVMESARQYARSAEIAVILAAAIRALGYPARAHIDGNYRVIAPLIAKDAGLGEIGRMSLLMTPRLGPRVRLAIVTTDLPLLVDQPIHDPTVLDFCTRCQKCAEVCPSQAIPFGDRQAYPDGTLRWRINAERCFTYWTRIGTDCGRCMAVCPYSHPDHAFHNLIRWGVARSACFRRAAIRLDDVFYGKQPTPLAPPDWVQDQ